MKKHLAVLGVFLGLMMATAPSAFAHVLTVANARVTCSYYCLDLTAESLTPGESDNIKYTFILTSTSGATLTVTGSVDFTVDSSGMFSTTICPPSWPGGTLFDNYTVTGTATLTTPDTSSTLSISFGGSSSTDLNCGPTQRGKSFSIGPSSMEGDLANIRPGDWISGGYSFKFVASNHAATTYTVTSSVTLPVYCPDGGGSGGDILIPLGTQVLDIPAGDTNWHRTGDQNNILTWEGAVQAPNLCSGNRMRNQRGAVFNSTVSQDPQVGLVDWRFHYRDPAAKGKPNTNCTDATDPNRNRADVCGASWSQTFRDP
jgi:hypothetical protein